MKLCPKEFEAMQMGWRKWYIREIELRTFKKFGLWIKDRDILEVGCGSGYASSLITAEALFSFKELEREANRRGFRTVKKAIDLGMEGYFRFQKE